jgi:hypothetical protein
MYMTQEFKGTPEDWKLTLTQMLPLPGRLGAEGAVVEAEARAARFDLDKAVRDVLVQVRESDQELLYIRDAKRVAAQNRELLDQLRKVSESAYAQNRALSLDNGGNSNWGDRQNNNSNFGDRQNQNGRNSNWGHRQNQGDRPDMGDRQNNNSNSGDRQNPNGRNSNWGHRQNQGNSADSNSQYDNGDRQNNNSNWGHRQNQGDRPDMGDRPKRGESPFKGMDSNNDGSISSDEFQSWNSSHSHPNASEDSQTFFNKLDQNGDGALSSDEMKPPRPIQSQDDPAASSSIEL